MINRDFRDYADPAKCFDIAYAVISYDDCLRT